MIKDAIAKLVEGRPLTDQEASFSMRETMAVSYTHLTLPTKA